MSLLKSEEERHYLEEYINKLFRLQHWMAYNEEYDFSQMQDALIEAIEIMKKEHVIQTNGKHPYIQEPKYAWAPKPWMKAPWMRDS